MKKNSYLLLPALAVLAFPTFQGCKEDDTPPKITIIGSTDTLIARNTVYVDLGATAEDETDDLVYVISDFSPTNPDETIPDSYIITYKSQDRNANMASVTRTVNVTWTGSAIAYTYAVTDTSQFDTLAYSSTINTNPINPYQIYITNLANATSFSGSAYANLKGKTVTIPSQRPDGMFSQYIVSGTGTIIEQPPNIIWNLYYTIRDTANAPGTEYRHAFFLY